MRFFRQSMIGLFLAAVTLGLMVYAAQIVGSAVQDRMARETQAPPARERVFAVNVRQAVEQTEIPVLDTFGEVHSRRTLELRAAVGGRVLSLSDRFEDGGTVQAGDVLLRIDPADAQAALDRLQADLADAEAEARDAARVLVLERDELAAASEQAALREKAYQRQVDLQSRGVGTSAAVETAELAASSARQAVLARRQSLTQAEARIDQATTRIARARIAVSEAERKLADTTLIAPFDGTLGATSVVAGRLVNANERLADLIDTTDLEVSFVVSTAQYARLLDAQGVLIPAPVTATLDVSGVDLMAEGTLSRASATAGAGQTGRLLFAGLERPLGFQPGDFVTLRVQEPALENVVRLPAAAVDASNTVLVIGENDRLEQLSVDVLRRQGDDVLVRGAGLPGREVVEARTPLLGAGVAVRPLRRDAPVAEAPAMVELTEERRAKLIAFVEGNARMPQEAKARILARLAEPEVPAEMVERLESRMRG